VGGMVIGSWPMRAVLVVVAVATLAAGCDQNDQKYSRGDVEHAFRSQGFNLAKPIDLSGGPLDSSAHAGVIYLPRTRERFVILVYDHDGDADEDFEALRSMASPETFDVQKGNVVISSDLPVTAPMQKRIRAALKELD